MEDTYAAEILLEPLYDLTNARVVYRDLPRFPGMERDLAIVVNEEVEAGSLIQVIKEIAGELLRRFRCLTSSRAQAWRGQEECCHLHDVPSSGTNPDR